MKEELELEQPSLLPIFPFKTKPAKIEPGVKYDSLFRGGRYLSIKSKKLGKKVTVSSDLDYWQIYTPDEQRIAVEPKSFSGNIHKIKEQMGNEWKPLPNSGKMEIKL